jgi:transcriptional regulator with XRE-family HTH domain
MGRRITTEHRPWHYTECGLDNVYLVGIEVETNPTTGEEDLIIPDLEDLHDCIFLAIVSKRGLLAGRELRYLRRHLLWTQAEAAERLGFNGPQYISDIESRKTAFDIRSDFFCRFVVLNAFCEQSSGERKRQGRMILKCLERVLQTLRKPQRSHPLKIKRVDTRHGEIWQPPLPLVA